METKQQISKQPTCNWRNQKGNKKISRNKWQGKHDNSKPAGCSKSSSKREDNSNIILPQETRKTLNRQQQNRQTDKSTKLEMKKERLQQTVQKYKGS